MIPNLDVIRPADANEVREEAGLLATLPEHLGPKIIYANGCRIGEQRLRELGITFKQIPYEIRER